METSKSEPKKEEMEENKRKEPKKIQIEEEEQFVKLFDEVLQQNRGSLSDEAIADGVDIAIQNFRIAISGACTKEKYDKPKMLCGFFHRYTSLFATVTRSKFFIALQKSEELKYCFHRPTVKLVDIGSGPGSCLVGLFSALESCDETFNKEFGSLQYKSLEVTAVDYNEDWKNYFVDIVKKLMKGNFGNASKLFSKKHIKCDFAPFDLLNRSNSKLKNEFTKILNEADIILMKGFLSILENNDYRHKTVENIATAMKPGSLLVIIESPTYEVYFQKEGLRLVFTTRKFLSASSESFNLNETSADSLQHSTSQNTNLTSLDSNMTTSFSSNPEDQGFISQNLGSESLTSDTELQASDSESDHVWQNYNPDREPDIIDKIYLSVPEVKKYGKGFSSNGSNQQLFVLVKK
ncbi:uncharacterized protein LOC129984168 [Argiope bruennichi]|uniref:Uncharacterized protein n=1 Tax=Argiope bruennichi TaxID=94029 RepID=A0A8T0ELP1_ARGBR|nr:uncharacterized protein LOC129984168 [Argiope bruennichi]KAF8773616.1 hypothetical protein HNY73_016260 [Argiope bruennichi]